MLLYCFVATLLRRYIATLLRRYVTGIFKVFPQIEWLATSLQRIFGNYLSKQELGLARHLATSSFKISKVKEYLV